MTQEQRKNLEKLSEYLIKGELKAKFDMKYYFYEEEDIHGNACGTVGCAIGHTPYIGIEKLKSESWVEYSERCFGVNIYQLIGKYLFCPHWSYKDNTAKGAGLRIKHFLKNGLPENWYEQIHGKEELTYLKEQ